MKPSRKISRRSFLGRVGGGSLMAGSFLALTGCVGYGYSDSDPYDPAGGGARGARGWGRPRGGGASDNDSGPNGDPAGQGRGGQGRGGVSDSDSGPNGDPAGQGRRGGGSGYSDSDSGPNADP